MSLIDRYTLIRFKETVENRRANLVGGLVQLAALCNANTKSRLVSLALLIVVIVLIFGFVGLLRPEPSAPMMAKLVLTRVDSDGIQWMLDYLKNQDLDAISNSPTKPGEPLNLTSEVRFLRPFVYIKPVLTGAAGEEYFPGIVRDSQWQKAPSFTISNENGIIIHRAQFEYG